MRKIIVFFLASLISIQFYAQNKPAYKLYNSKGVKISFKRMVKQLKKSDIILFGEFHDNPIVHWLEYEVTSSLNKHKNLILGAEMFESDNQQLLNNYLKDSLTQKGLDTLARLWKNYKTDYKPLLDLAKKNHLKFIATNVPRKYASEVYKGGFEVLDSLTDIEKTWMAPLPILFNANLKSYVKMSSLMEGHSGENLSKAQAIKDATMAYFILRNKVENNLFIHFNGAYHSDNFEGINWYLKKQNPSLIVKTISVVEAQNVSKFKKENKNLADFIIVVPISMTKTY